MSTVTLTTDLELDLTTCGECGGTYGLAKRYVDQKRKKSGFWNCPYCKVSWGYRNGTDLTENERLQRELEAAQRSLNWAREDTKRANARADHQAAKARGYKGAMVKTKKRVAAGVCPCCNRTFQQLARHMKSQHPEYVEKVSDG